MVNLSQATEHHHQRVCRTQLFKLRFYLTFYQILQLKLLLAPLRRKVNKLSYQEIVCF